MTEAHNKIVRDQIPEIMEASGQRPVVRVLDATAARLALMDKLAEQADELRQSSAEDSVEEIADLLEVVRGLAEPYGVSWDDVVRTADDKVTARGAFRRRLFLERVDEA